MMRSLWFCVVTTVIVSVSSGVVDVEKTVQQVQDILQTNAGLPRLSRDEIIQLLYDIRAEDSKSSSLSKEESVEVQNSVKKGSEESILRPGDLENSITEETDNILQANSRNELIVESTTLKQNNVMVVLPYTTQDGSSLQDLYTKPPRVKVVPESKVFAKTESSGSKLIETLKSNALLANKHKKDYPADLQRFLNSHEFKGSSQNDFFLLPLEGFKPLPPARIVDDSVELPENILLAYDLITPTKHSKYSSNRDKSTQNQFLFDPLPPKLSDELQTSSSEVKKTVLPLDLPKSRKNKSTSTQTKSLYEPINYHSIKVIPLKKGLNPSDEVKFDISNEQIKRQAETLQKNESTTTTQEPTTLSVINEVKTNPPPADLDSAVSSADAGASITDLEDSFGGEAPIEPFDSMLPSPKKNGFYWMLDWNSFLEVGDGDRKVNIRFEPKFGDPQMFLPVNVP